MKNLTSPELIIFVHTRFKLYLSIDTQQHCFNLTSATNLLS